MEELFNKVWQNFHKALFYFIKKNISNTEDAEDILQNVFLKIHSNIHRLKEKEKISSWLYQITRNTIIDTFRARAKNKVEILPLVDNKAGTIISHEEESLKQEVNLLLMKMVEDLPEKYRTVLKWYEFDGLTHQNIAHRLGISVSGSKTRLQRSREKLKELLICGCHSEVEANRNISISTYSTCSHQVKIRENYLCVKRLQN